LTSVLAEVPAGAHVTVELSVDFLDHAIYDVLAEWTRQHEHSGGTVVIEETGSARMATAAHVPPTRSTTLLNTRIGLSPWKSWLRHRTQHEGSDRHRGMGSVLSGVAHYHRKHAPLIRPHLDELSAGQNPDTLFLTCADSRVMPNVITSSGPGDLFTVRNMGNLVPASGDDSVDAALAFALDELSIEAVVICGHSGCGAMHALLDEQVPQSDAADVHPALGRWLDHAQPSRDAYLDGHPVAAAAAASGFGPVDQLSMVNVARQLDTLAEHPLVEPRHRAGTLELAGLFFDIPTARLFKITRTSITDLDATADPVHGHRRPTVTASTVGGG
jgi:carbonic anhydrase